MLERNALQARSTSTGKRLESERRQRLQRLSPSQLELLARGSSDELYAMAAFYEACQLAHHKAATLFPTLQKQVSNVYSEIEY